MAGSIFTSGPVGTILPTEHARGPWDPRALHGGAPAALIATAFQETTTGEDGGRPLVIARMSFELLRPVPTAPLSLKTTVTRPGRRVQGLRAELRTVDGALVCEARATRIIPVISGLPVVPEHPLAEGEDPDVFGGPEEGRQIRFSLNEASDHHDFATAMDMRLISGGPLEGPGGSDPRIETEGGDGHGGIDRETHGGDRRGDRETHGGDRPGLHDRRTRMWMRPRYPLFPDRPMSALARVAAAADFGNGISAAIPFKDYLFINADLAIALTREPLGEWIALDAVTHLPAGGVGWAQSVIHDIHGPVGWASQALVVRPR